MQTPGPSSPAKILHRALWCLSFASCLSQRHLSDSQQRQIPPRVLLSVTSVTVAICTWNRHELLRQTLEEMTKLEVPEDVQWELLVVNNSCTDATDQVIASFAERLPIRRLYQPAAGLSNARNLVCLEAVGDFVIWTDDDVLVSPQWIREYVCAFRANPEAAVFGGPITPWFPNEPPDWLQASWLHVANAYAAVDYSDKKIPLSFSRVPFGANMAVRTDCVRTYPYRPDLGVRPGSRMGGEETDVLRRVLADGHSGWWVPGAGVRHYIPVARQTREYLRGWFYAYGQFLGQHGENSSQARDIFGRPRWLWKQVVVTAVRYQLRRHRAAPSACMQDLIAASIARGQFRSFLRRKELAAPSATQHLAVG